MDAIASMAFELEPAGQAAGGAVPGGAAGTAAVFDVSHFDAAFAAASNGVQSAAQAPHVSGSESQGFRTVMATLENLNGRAESLGTKALEMQHGEFKPADMLMMTLKAQEFLFHCELTSNVANRTSEGVQQLFREQS